MFVMSKIMIGSLVSILVYMMFHYGSFSGYKYYSEHL